MFRPIEEIQPEIITIGFNQMFNEENLAEQLRARTITSRIVRIGKYAEGELCSSRLVVKRILDKRCHDQHPPREKT
jgi:FAD synthetase